MKRTTNLNRSKKQLPETIKSDNALSYSVFSRKSDTKIIVPIFSVMPVADQRQVSSLAFATPMIGLVVHL